MLKLALIKFQLNVHHQISCILCISTVNVMKFSIYKQVKYLNKYHIKELIKRQKELTIKRIFLQFLNRIDSESPYNNKQRNYTAFRLKHRNIMGIGQDVGYKAAQQLSNRISSVQQDFKSKQFSNKIKQFQEDFRNKQYGLTLYLQPKGQQTTKLINTLNSARSQSVGWRLQSRRWSEICWSIVCMLIGFALFYSSIQMIQGSSGTNVERKGILEERKIQMKTVVHKKMDQILEEHQNKLNKGSIQINGQFRSKQINRQFGWKDFGFKDDKPQASLKLILNFKNNQMKHQYQITGYLSDEIAFLEKKGDYVVSVDPSPKPASFILGFIGLPVEIIGILGLLLMAYTVIKMMKSDSFGSKQFWQFRLYLQSSELKLCTNHAKSHQ